MTETEFRLTVNGAECSVTCEPDTPLLDVLRHDLGLAGPRFSCGTGLCGACMVLIGSQVVIRPAEAGAGAHGPSR
jgi:aerobic-type carbon monoxide dehydrogenase small subunit (CoxS/CutS family)